MRFARWGVIAFGSTPSFSSRLGWHAGDINLEEKGACLLLSASLRDNFGVCSGIPGSAHRLPRGFGG